jgi:hypothetical protein
MARDLTKNIGKYNFGGLGFLKNLARPIQAGFLEHFQRFGAALHCSRFENLIELPAGLV